MLRDSFWILGYNSITKLWEHKAVHGAGNGGILGGRDRLPIGDCRFRSQPTFLTAIDFVLICVIRENLRLILTRALPIADWRLPI